MNRAVRLALVFGAAALVTAAGSAAGASTPPASSDAPATTEAPAPTEATAESTSPVESAPAESTPATEAPAAPATTAAEAASVWERIVPGGDCQCADGAEFSFFVRKADPAKVLLFFEGGGACWDAIGCAFTDAETTTYDWNIGPDDNPETNKGAFDLTNPENPFADYSMIWVPYCTGDVHIGNATTEYSPELTVQHKGYVNGTAAVQYLADNFPDATQVVVSGASAGSVASPLYGGLVSDAVAAADVIVFGDGSGGYPDVPGVNALVGTAWGSMNAIPDWEVNEGVTVETWSLPGLWIKAGTHDPEIVMSRFDFAFDEVQVFFAGIAGVAGENLVDFLDQNEAQIEAAGVDQASFTAPGTDHTMIQTPEFYTIEVDGVRVVDWLTAILNGEEVEDVHCTECGAPATADTSA